MLWAACYWWKAHKGRCPTLACPPPQKKNPPTGGSGRHSSACYTPPRAGLGCRQPPRRDPPALGTPNKNIVLRVGRGPLATCLAVGLGVQLRTTISDARGGGVCDGVVGVGVGAASGLSTGRFLFVDDRPVRPLARWILSCSYRAAIAQDSVARPHRPLTAVCSWSRLEIALLDLRGREIA